MKTPQVVAKISDEDACSLHPFQCHNPLASWNTQSRERRKASVKSNQCKK